MKQHLKLVTKQKEASDSLFCRTLEQLCNDEVTLIFTFNVDPSFCSLTPFFPQQLGTLSINKVTAQLWLYYSIFSSPLVMHLWEDMHNCFLALPDRAVHLWSLNREYVSKQHEHFKLVSDSNKVQFSRRTSTSALVSGLSSPSAHHLAVHRHDT